jgi:cysteine-rich repeat protein
MIQLSVRLLFLPPLLAALAVPASAAQRCGITLSASGPLALGALKARVGYAAAAGEFAGSEGNVECVALAPGAYAAARDDDAGRELSLGMVSVIGVSLPADFWRCTFDSDGDVPDAGSFALAVDDALTTEGAPTTAVLTVSEIACGSESSCGNGIVEEGEECDFGGATVACDSTCRLTRDSQRCSVGFRVTGSGSLGGIQFRVGYGSVNGEFEGSGPSVSCGEAIAPGLTAADDRDGEEELSLAFISAVGLGLPIDLWRCAFVTNAVPLLPQNFQLRDVMATDAMAAAVPVSVAAVVTGCIYGPYCGDGTVDPGEVCDDGNRINTDACTNSCEIAVCGDGVVRTGVEQCDDSNTIAGDCCSSDCGFESGTTVCRAAAGTCDLAENCTGASGACPADLKRTTVCRGAAGICDIAELCDGVGDQCPADVRSTAQCRASTGACDLGESCSGVGVDCPADQFQPLGIACASDANICTTDQCDGFGACAHTANSAPCDDGLFCNGADTCAAGTCSVHSGSPCPGVDGDSDCSESCAESTDSCTANDPELAACDDGNAATSGDQCLGGFCVGSSVGSVCGDADANGSVGASDALRVLRAAVGHPVECPVVRCDTDGNGTIAAADALRVLKKAVGQGVDLNCPV